MRWWWLVAICVALGGGLGYFVRSQQPDLWFAKSSVLFDQNIISGRGEIQERAAILGVIQTYAGLARTSQMLLPVIRDLNLNISVDALNGVFAVNPAANLPLLEITVANTNREIAANIANRIAQEIVTVSGAIEQNDLIEFQRAQLRDLSTQIETLQNQINDLNAQAASLQDAFSIQRNLQQRTDATAALREIQQLYADMSASMLDDRSLLTIYERASVETAWVVTGSAMSIVLSGIAGLILSVGTIVLIGYFDDRLQWNENIQTVHGLKVLGPLGQIPRNKLPLYTVTMADSPEAEVLRQVRAKLVLASGGISPKVVTVTSYDSGDGKTTTSANLAMTSAQSGLRTLLIDGDTRKGNAHEIFKLPNIMGLSDILASRNSLSDLLSQALLETGHENLTLLPCGRSTADPASLLSGPRFEQLVGILQDRFDVVVMDSVPTIGGPDSAFMAEASDGVVIVVHAQRTTNRALNRTIQTLQQGRQVNIYGVVFNRIPLQVTSTYHQPYYRRNLAISPERLERELQNSTRRRLLPALNSKVIRDRSGDALYSFPAAAVQLGISTTQLKEWIKNGTLSPERRGLRMWIHQKEMERMINHLPRLALQSQTDSLPQPESTDNTNGRRSASLPDRLRDQRDAILGYAQGNEPGEQ
jgi:capsular exopolysaccharide synthesis family protein